MGSSLLCYNNSMNQIQFQEEKILVDKAGKQIIRVKQYDTYYIVKTFFQHDNVEVYRILMNNPHQNISRIYAIDDEGVSFTVKEQYLGTETLADKIPILDDAVLYDIAIQLCDALEHLHKLKIVHRDIKPENIYMLNGRVILNDFDISKPIVRNTLSRKDTHVLGSVGYASPEQYGFSRSDERSDIYSLGVVLNVISSGKLLSEEVSNTFLKSIILKCAEVNRDDRFQSMSEVKHALMQSRHKGSRYTLPGFRTKHRYKMVIAVFGYLLIGAIIVFVESEDATVFYDHFKSKVLMACMLLPILVISTNYLNIQSLIPRPLRKHRIIGSALLWGALFVFIIILYLLIFGIIDSLLGAYQ